MGGTEQPRSAHWGRCSWIHTTAPSRASWYQFSTHILALVKRRTEELRIGTCQNFYCWWLGSFFPPLQSWFFLLGTDRERLDLLWPQVCWQVRFYSISLEIHITFVGNPNGNRLGFQRVIKKQPLMAPCKLTVHIYCGNDDFAAFFANVHTSGKMTIRAVISAQPNLSNVKDFALDKKQAVRCPWCSAIAFSPQ